MPEQLISKIFLFVFVLTTIVSCFDKKKDGGSSDLSPLLSLPPGPEPSVVYMWTRTPGERITGNLGGIDEADDYCRTEGESKSGNNEFATSVENHRAMLSTSLQDPRRFFGNSPPVQRPDGTQIIDSYEDFLNPEEDLDVHIEDSGDYYWTGISVTGAPSDDNCDDWTSDSLEAKGSLGYAKDKTNRFFSDPSTTCNFGLRILCVSY